MLGFTFDTFNQMAIAQLNKYVLLIILSQSTNILYEVGKFFKINENNINKMLQHQKCKARSSK
jgi:hypothetical protein